MPHSNIYSRFTLFSPHGILDSAFTQEPDEPKPISKGVSRKGAEYAKEIFSPGLKPNDLDSFCELDNQIIKKQYSW
jgi:hypothetical protein